MTRRRRRLGCLPILGIAAVVIIGVVAIALRPATLPRSEALPAKPAPAVGASLRPVADFASIADDDARSVALFVEAGRVIQSPRCLNCHPRGDQPTQTDAMRVHTPPVNRGPDGGGASTLRCTTCHHAENVAASGVPGDPMWRLAPVEMAWQGKTLGEICRQIQGPSRGGMARAELAHHMAEDHLVGWAWRPGGDRKPAPGTQAEFGALIQAWLDTGARCPA